MNIKRMLAVGLLLGMLPAAAWAEIYKYRDAGGVLRYTDNYLEVPEDQRSRTETLEEIKTANAPEEEATAPAAEKPSPEDMQAREKALRSEKEKLDQLYDQLARERAQLEAEAKSPKSGAERDVFEEKVNDYNARTRAYEEMRTLFKQKVDAFNQLLMAE